MSNQAAAINGAKWTTSATIINTVLSFCQLAIVAKVLDPAIFGLVSICTLVLNFFHIFANLGFTNSIISKQEQDKNVLSTIFFASIGLGFIMGALIYFSAGFVVDYYNEPKLSYAIKVSAITFPMIYTSQIYWNLLQKELEFKILAIIEVIGAVINIILTITLAYSGFEELSLIYSQIIFTAVKTILYIVLGRKLFTPTLYFKLGEIKDHLRFGLYHLAEGILGFINGNMVNIVIGKAVGLKELGLYTIACQLAILPISRLNPIIMQVSYPIMAKMRDNEGLKRAYLKIVDFITFCNYPLLAGLYITASTVVVMVYGPEYEGSVQLVKIVLFISFLACLVTPASSVAMSKNKPNLMFYMNLASAIIKIPILYFLSQNFGLLGIAYGFVISTVIEIMMVFYIVKYLLGSFVKEMLYNVIKPLVFSTIMVAVIAFYQHFIGNTGLIHLLVQIIIGGLIYVGLTLKYKLSVSEILALKKSL